MFCGEADFLALLRQGFCGVFPTDTVAGLGALPQFAQQIYRLKQREHTKPLILLAANLSQIKPLCIAWESDWEVLMRQFWPGAVTLVLPASAQVPAFLQHEGMVGLRIPNHPTALNLLTQSGPLATTSINRSGAAPLLQPQQIREQFPDLPLLAGDYAALGVPSTVLRWQARQWELLRLGAVPWP